MKKWILIVAIFSVAGITFYERTLQAEKTIEKKGDLVFIDKFEYDVSRDDSLAREIFQKQGGWHWVKTMQSNEPGAKGFLYTVTRIPGYSGEFPGKNSKRVLVQESAGATYRGQTDFYLQYGGAKYSRETIPGDVWLQFWIYPNHYDDPDDKEDQLSQFGHRMKFIYPCNGDYPCHDASWLLMLGTTSNEPFFKELGIPGRDLYLNVADYEDMDYTRAKEYPENRWKLGQTDVSELIVHNRWTLVKIHIDTSTQSGKVEAWLRPYNGKWKKVVSWEDGKDSLNWKVSNPGGHRVFRMPTTIGGGHGHYNSWIYMDDFAIARKEDSLPIYP